MTLFNLVGVTMGAIGGRAGDYFDVVSHLYGQREIDEIKQAQAEKEAMNRSLSVMGRFRAIADRME